MKGFGDGSIEGHEGWFRWHGVHAKVKSILVDAAVTMLDISHSSIGDLDKSYQHVIPAIMKSLTQFVISRIC